MHEQLYYYDIAAKNSFEMQDHKITNTGYTKANILIVNYEMERLVLQ
uniref:Uncharacterized protein n=1 Tax=Anguilla anguilla TaxID=7936 RepID=A0A0E9QPQ7_ANGAN